MTEKITCFLAGGEAADLEKTLQSFSRYPGIEAVYLLQEENNSSLPQVKAIGETSFTHTASLRKIAKLCTTPYLLFYTASTPLLLGEFSLERLLQTLQNTSAAFVYSDFYEYHKEGLQAHPLSDYQTGSLRDDFDFGPLVVFDTLKFRKAIDRMTVTYEYAGFYNLRLQLSLQGEIFRLPELLYTLYPPRQTESGEKIFHYVDPKNRNVQSEMEKVCTAFLQETGALVNTEFPDTDVKEGVFPVEASIIIPVQNRERTIADAVHSALMQKTTFPYNVIVVNNHSTDRTTELLRQLAATTPQLIHLIPEHTDLGIGGCWNKAITDARCGRFCVQLDSDDLYIDETVLQRIVTTFYRQKCAAVIGAYRLVDFQLREIPPGLIDHREWTPENGPNNALRINGLGAPRAFYTPLIRKIKFPNTSYGEDYAVMLAISRNHRIGRIYDPLYFCRRWEGNSDASLNIEKENANNLYKDRIRTIEWLARRQQNRIQ